MKLAAIIVTSAALLIPAKASAYPVGIVKKAINQAFCGAKTKTCYLGQQAFTVVSCETGYTYDIYARNGQYKGLFQMGDGERATYGFAWSPFAQATGARKYFNYAQRVYSDGGWHPWDCAYRMGII